jgi:hypothetical protein
MTNKLFVFFLTLALVAGCGPVEENKSKKIPQNILNLDKLLEVFYVINAEGFARVFVNHV